MLREIAQLHLSCGVYTKPKVAAAILDSIGWTARSDLSNKRLLEPAAGDGAFLVEAARRLAVSMKRREGRLSIRTLGSCIRAYELHPPEAEIARERIRRVLVAHGASAATAAACARTWLITGDFLLRQEPPFSFTHAAGNPPYIRWRKIPSKLRERYEQTLNAELIGGDLFLPFVDRVLEALCIGGACGLLCSDRWKYMAFADAFRKKWLDKLTIAENKSVLAADVFEKDVSSYASILIARRESAPLASRPKIRVRKKTLHELGCTVRVGPALGHTPAFVLDADELDDVEGILLKKWVDGSEIIEGEIATRSRRVVEMHRGGSLIRLATFPRLRNRLRRYKGKLVGRAVVTDGAPWYTTIDRVCASDWKRPKLLVPELSRVPRLAIDTMGRIPAHGVYAIFAPDDDVHGLYARLRDGRLANALMDIAPRVSGGYVRCYKRFLLEVLV